MTLNCEQKKAVDKTCGPCIILAGAGTGKTFTIVEKIKNLIENTNLKPNEILALTFSNDAANSLDKKINSNRNNLNKIENNNNSSNNINIESIKNIDNQNTQNKLITTVKTFHGFCFDIIKENFNDLNLNENVQILMPNDCKIFIKKNMEIDFHLVENYYNTISKAKDFGIKIEDYEKYLDEILTKLNSIFEFDKNKIKEFVLEIDFRFKTLYLDEKIEKGEKNKIKTFLELYEKFEKYNKLLEVWKKYELKKNKENYLDLSDLNEKVLELFKKFGEEKYLSNFKYIIIDEFQDTNKIQFELLEFLAKKHKNITIVGDPNQSIYGFRGSYKESFNHFKKVFETKIDDEINLVESWRSTNKILNVAHNLILNNYENKEECFKTFNAQKIEGEKVKLNYFLNNNYEAENISNLIKAKIKSGVKPSQICILFRKHEQIRFFTKVLKKNKIKFLVKNSDSILDYYEIKIIISYLSILNNFENKSQLGDISWWNLFEEYGIEIEDLVKIGTFLKKNKIKSINDLLFSKNSLNLSNKSEIIFNSILEDIEELKKIKNSSINKIVQKIILKLNLNQNTDEIISFLKLIEEFNSKYENSLNSFIDYIETIINLNINLEVLEDKNSEKENLEIEKNSIRIQTIHSSKGLEYEIVILPTLNHWVFPTKLKGLIELIPNELRPEFKQFFEENSHLDEKKIKKELNELRSQSNLIEERRLAYVAFTRAKKELYLSYCVKNNQKEVNKSIFIEEILENDNLENIEFKSYIDENKIEEEKQNLINNNNINENKLNNKIENLELNENENKKNKLTLPFSLSPSAIIEYEECPRKYFYTRLLQIPHKNNYNNENDAGKIGNIVHEILEFGVKKEFKTEIEFLNYTNSIIKIEKLEENKNEILTMIRVFFKRNQNKFNSKSKVEFKLPYKINDFNFFGLADRIDELEDGSLEIIDYKSNKNKIESEKKIIQMGYYILATKQNLNKNISKVTLEMLKLEKPLEMFVKGNLVIGPDKRTKSFDLNELENKFLEIAKKIKMNLKTKFDFKPLNQNCKYCSYKFYCETKTINNNNNNIGNENN